MRETIPDLSRCIILALRSELLPNYEDEHFDSLVNGMRRTEGAMEPVGIVEVFTLDYLNPMGFYETHVWTEER